ncbi:unnamed protein product, partial [Closterium sp. Yama58-4]
MAVPFQVTPEEARALLREHLTGHLLAPAIADVDSSVTLSAVFQPFWTFTADGGCKGWGGESGCGVGRRGDGYDLEVAYRANVGKASSAMAWNPYSRRWEQVVNHIATQCGRPPRGYLARCKLPPPTHSCSSTLPP